MADSHLKAVLLPALLAATSVGLFAQQTVKVVTEDGSSNRTTVNSVQPRVPVTGKQWVGPASTDYVGIEQSAPVSPPNPSIAVGPDHILSIVNRKIWAYKNPNSPDNSLVADPKVAPLVGQEFLTFWLGEQLNVLCPTQPRDNSTCIVDNASVMYDQMHGRFVVGFTVVDNGVTLGYQLAPTQRHQPGFARKASWVLIISKYAQLNLTASEAASPFGDPNPGNGSVGGVTTKNWLAYYGDINDISNYTFLTPDGITTGNPPVVKTKTNTIATGNAGNEQYKTSAKDPLSGAAWVTGFENAKFQTPIQTINNALHPQIDCQTAAPVLGTSCFMPTSMRIGIDNNNIVIASAVIDDNILLAARTPATPAYAGARVRVYRKKTLYSWQSPTSLSRWASGNPASNFVDLYNTGDNVAGGPYTNMTVGELDANSALLPVFYEPDHLRGRAIASFNSNFAGGCFIWANQPTSSSANPCDDSTSYLIGAKSTNNDPAAPPVPNTVLFVRGVSVAPLGAIANPPIALAQWVPTLLATKTAIVPQFWNPGTWDYSTSKLFGENIPQFGPGAKQVCSDGTTTCKLYVGDDRPQTVVYREGYLYVARVGQTPNAFVANGTTEFSTVIYDVIRKWTNGGAPQEVLYAQWQNTNAWGPMYESPANVSTVGQASPIYIFPWLEKLFVSTTYNYGPSTQPNPLQNNMIFPSLYDIKLGEDFYDRLVNYLNPVTGTIEARNVFGFRGGSSTDPNNGSLWNFGAYAKARASSNAGFGQWGTYVSNYNLDFAGTDPYGTTTQLYTDVPPTHPFYVQIQIAKNVGIGPSGSTFGPDNTVSRSEMARWVVLSQMDEAGITAYLMATGGCYTSFADVAPDCNFLDPTKGTDDFDPVTGKIVTTPNPPADGQGCSAKTSTGAAKAVDATCGFWRYIETMYRRGYTKGKGACTNDPRAGYCPNDLLTRAEMSTFLIRAKMNNVFPTVLSGCPASSPACADIGDNFGLFFGNNSYFTDVDPATSPYFPYISKMREMRIANGTSSTKFSPDDTLTRGQIAVFMVRAFFQ